MSHGDCVTVAPAGFTVTASRPGDPSPPSSMSPKASPFPVPPRGGAHPYGQRCLSASSYDVAKIEPTWTMGNIIDEQLRPSAPSRVRSVICGLSGGVDSAVAARSYTRRW